ncbi:aminoacyl-tRNA hydrolase [Ferrimonas balearica]|uniref:aminoacyl-tRNA hydrolase n=1 Tax=Ferrimonas balearica TaxID=44012 RepID=UPI001C996118|nr:aminoacyl-tRNA hydrolase [Ferrimonas balearica]MBY5992737.1 aminoacyl-tRNA hydrolase [Ferrimonas balearica]
MSNNIRLIVGLANPGPEYAHTRHNAGEWLVNELARTHNVTLKSESKFFGLTGRIQSGGKDLRLLIPTTFMNLSGKSVATLANFYDIAPEEIMVAHDELDLPPGVARFKLGGGHGGHNGLKDIISRLGNNKNFYRLRIGIGHPGDRNRVTGYVLGKAPAAEQRAMDEAIDEASRSIDILLSDGITKAQNRLHTFSAQPA